MPMEGPLPPGVPEYDPLLGAGQYNSEALLACTDTCAPFLKTTIECITAHGVALWDIQHHHALRMQEVLILFSFLPTELHRDTLALAAATWYTCVMCDSVPDYPISAVWVLGSAIALNLTQQLTT